jgi:hypothetical protein
MQKTIRNLVLLLVMTSFFWGCENEVNIAADWKEIAVVYGAINPNQAKNYIRIQRAYLDEDQAALAFSNNFDSLDVTLEEFANSSYSQTFTLRKVNGNDIGMEKDSGLFYSEDNFLYELSDPIKPSQFATDYQYKLVVRNPKTGYVCRATISSIGQAEIKGPISNTGGTIYFSNESIPVTFQEGKYARAYKVEMDFRVRETRKDDPSQEQVIDYKWTLVNLGKTQSLRGFELGRYLVASSGFFTNLSSVMPQDINIERKLVDFDLTFYGISDDFNTYLSVNKPSIGIVQKKPEFTNIENGIGLFASRNIASFENLSFHPSTIGLIQTNEKTKDLGFIQ